mgnify:CR=1 FL=1
MELNYLSKIGMQVMSPSGFAYIAFDNSERKTSKWEKRRDAIVYKMKVRKSIFNYFLTWIITIIGFCIIFSVLIMVAGWVSFVYFSILTGLAIGYLTLLLYFYINELFEKNTSFIRVKHRNKTY